ncbi:hypothetical protein M9H77_12554 [Catharanthus roseus]|uniref:Uncharacterized protein n=1 Tax=Catharanthus roseus TaxID=4058 RepID=A0ACC0BHR7_CATRO|nr:hypothetical protein M9H77_12554 [Catharanthus roseus]
MAKKCANGQGNNLKFLNQLVGTFFLVYFSGFTHSTHGLYYFMLSYLSFSHCFLYFHLMLGSVRYKLLYLEDCAVFFCNFHRLCTHGLRFCHFCGVIFYYFAYLNYY